MMGSQHNPTEARRRAQRAPAADPLGLGPLRVIERDGIVRTATDTEALNARHRRRAMLRGCFA
jgi:hypothetical protein